ncbi:MAG TPA: hypothetical protein PK079_23255 [Leptospiraceae bacterium]|nr:hypothetical protein [Leptospiraceae bacterium]HMX30964.1 hypothetical protein [Leptospiraceae bacterium]HMY34310.1 hypothetical protein [Leptospiraceae bacterium]HMZ63782.1 hypothetical protein [Leptospiraceae bacterium]HNE56099.1 hypothetical protein [Leptospiraceae bacterium]
MANQNDPSFLYRLVIGVIGGSLLNISSIELMPFKALVVFREY